MAISKTHEKGYTVYCKETKTDLKSLMNKYMEQRNQWQTVEQW